MTPPELGVQLNPDVAVLVRLLGSRGSRGVGGGADATEEMVMDLIRVQRWQIVVDKLQHDEIDVSVSWREVCYAEVDGSETKQFESDGMIGLYTQSKHADSRCGLRLSREKATELRDALNDALREIE